jgi:2-dehydropantoate 2-reductase
MAMAVLIWGAGAIGGTIGAYLSRAGQDVTLVDRDPAHVERVREHGLSIEGPLDEFTVRTQASLPEELTGEWRSVLLCVKAQDTEQATRQLQPYLSAEGYVVSVQNGLNELTISRLIGRERTIGAFVNFQADYLEPGRIFFGGRGAVVVGELDGTETNRLRELHSLLLQFDPHAMATHNIWGYLWSKMAYLAMLYATALTNDTMPGAFGNRRYREVYVALAHEVLSIARARGVTPEPFDGFQPAAFADPTDVAAVEQGLDELVTFTSQSGKTRSGMWRDLAIRGRPTEVDAQLGAVLSLAEPQGLTIGVISKTIELVHEIESGKRKLDERNLDVLLELTRETREAGTSPAAR